MARFLEALGVGGETKAVSRTLTRLEADKTPIRMEIEGENLRFFTVLSQKRGLVVVAKPPGLRAGLKRDGFVRFRVPNEARELRLEITVPHFNLVGGGAVFLCKVPKKFAAASKRGAERYNTSRFNNLYLLIPNLRTQFRVVDISALGCKIFLQQGKSKGVFRAGQQYAPAEITVGEKLSIALAGVIPRSVGSSTVGLQLQVGANGSARHLEHFLKSLEQAEVSSLNAAKA